MKDVIKSPTDTYMSPSSNSVFRRRPAFDGLRGFAAGALRKIMPKMRGKLPGLRRPRTAPYPAQLTGESDVERPDSRPVTAFQAENTPSMDHGPQVPAILLAEEHPTRALVEDKEEMLQVSRALFTKVVDLVRNDKELHQARKLAKCGEEKLHDWQSRIDNIHGGAKEMEEHLRETKESRASASDDQDESRRETDDHITMYQERWTETKHCLENISSQYYAIWGKLDSLEKDRDELQKEVYRAVCDVWLSSDDAPTTFAVDELTGKSPLEDDVLECWEEDLNNFILATKGEVDPRVDYPSQRTGDYVTPMLQMRNLRGEVAEQQRLLEERKATMTDASDTTQEATLIKEQYILESKQKELAEAIEDCRRTGVHLLDDGTELENLRGGPFWDLTLHGKETIIGYLNDEGSLHLFGDDDEPEEEMTQEEIDAYVARGQETTVTWLDRETLSMDPDEAGPFTPRTPGSAGLQAQLPEIELGETSNQESGMMHNGGEFQAQIAEWKASQEKQRTEVNVLITEHKKSMEDLKDEEDGDPSIQQASV